MPFNMQQGIPGLGDTLRKGFGYLDVAGNRLAELLGSKNASSMGGPNTSRPLTQIKEAGIDPGKHLGPKPEERAYVEEVSRIAQQPDPYMQNAGMYTPNVEQAYGKPMPERDYADEKDGLMGILNEMETANLQRMGYGNAPDLAQQAGLQNNESAAVDVTTDAEKLEASNNLQPMAVTSFNYSGFKGEQNVAQTPAQAFSLDISDDILAQLEQSRNKPDPRYRRQ